MKTILLFVIGVILMTPVFSQEEENKDTDKHHTLWRGDNVKTRWGILELGISGMDTKDLYTLENGADPFELRYVKSTNVNLHLIQQKVNIVRNHLNFIYGLTFEFHKYFFDNPVIMEPDEPLVQFTYVENANFKKNRLNYTYLTVPVLINIESNPHHMYRSFHLSAGVYGGPLIGANFKTKNGDKDKEKDNFNLSKWRYGIRGEIGYGMITFYGTVALNDLFQEEKNNGYIVTPYSVGLVIVPF
jgi:hypothetical protein